MSTVRNSSSASASQPPAGRFAAPDPQYEIVDRLMDDDPPGQPRKYPFRELRPGQAFFVPRGIDSKAATRAIQAARFYQRASRRAITWKRTEDGGVWIGRKLDCPMWDKRSKRDRELAPDRA